MGFFGSLAKIGVGFATGGFGGAAIGLAQSLGKGGPQRSVTPTIQNTSIVRRQQKAATATIRRSPQVGFTRSGQTADPAMLRLVAAHFNAGARQGDKGKAFLTDERIALARAAGLISDGILRRLPAPAPLAPPSNCVWPTRRDPLTGNCVVFAGEQSGPDGGVTQGAFGMPAAIPLAETRRHLSCPPGMVLGKDELCYPRAVLRRDSRFRKWRPGTRPVLTGGEVRAIAKARSAITRGRDRMAGLGVTVKKK